MMKFNSQLPKIWFYINKIKFGRNLRMKGWPFIFKFSNAKVFIGNNCTLNSNFLSNLIGLYQRTIIVARDRGIIDIGNNVGISGSTIYARENISIGDYTLIGANTKIIDNDFHSLDDVERMNDDYSNLKTKKISIGKNVFIGTNCIILKGTSIGDNCIVGAGSVVHGTFEDNCILAGNPAEIIKKRTV